MASPSVLNASLSSARALILLQLVSRLLTFSLNAILLRLASPEVFGTATIQFDLIGSTLLFLPREGVRGSLIRETDNGDSSQGGDKDEDETKRKKRKQQQSVNLSLIPLPIFLLLSLVILPIYLRTSLSSTTAQPHFTTSLALHLASYLLELLSEPYNQLLLSQLDVLVRVQAEGAAIIVKSVVTVSVLAGLGGERALLAFGIGQCAYGVTLLGVFVGRIGVGTALRIWVPRKAAGDEKYFSPAHLSLLRALTIQSLVKHFLTEGDRLILSRVSPLRDQGGYAVATNYGSLVARIIFQPIEESTRLYFSKSNSPEAGEAKVLTTLLLLPMHLALLLPSFGPPFVHTLLSIILSKRYLATSAPAVLRAYCWYLPLLAANGILESFHASTASPAALARQSRYMLFFSFAFLISAGMFAGLAGKPEEGLVWANCVNMICRIVYTARFALQVFEEKRVEVNIRDLWPGKAVISVFGFCAVLVRLVTFGTSVRARMEHVALGATCFVLCAAVCFVQEKQSLVALWRSFKTTKSE